MKELKDIDIWSDYICKYHLDDYYSVKGYYISRSLQQCDIVGEVLFYCDLIQMKNQDELFLYIRKIGPPHSRPESRHVLLWLGTKQDYIDIVKPHNFSVSKNQVETLCNIMKFVINRKAFFIKKYNLL